VEDLRETVEDLRETEEIQERATKMRVTILILIVTILGTIAAVMASLADAQAATAQRSQQTQALAAQQDQDTSASYLFSFDDRSNQAQLYFDRDAAWWIERNTAPAQTVHVMRATWLQRSRPWQKDVSASLDGYWNALATSQKAAELTSVDGQTVAAWREREDGYITAAAVLAVSLFLVGLVLTTHRRPYRRVFVAASILLAVFACIRMAQTASREIPSISQATLTAYTDGERALYQGDSQSAVTSLQRVVAQRPDTPEAWLGLGIALDSGAFPSRADLTRAVAAYRQAIADGASSSEAQDNLAFDELRLGRAGGARRDIASALNTRDAIDWSYAEGTLAEMNMVDGDPAQALADLVAAVNRISQRDPASVHDFFASLRDDQAYFARAGVPQARWQPFYAAAASAEASLDALYQPVPGQLGSAAIGGLKVRYYEIDQVDGQGVLRFRFSYRGFSKNGIFSFRTYDYSDGQYQLLDESSATRMDKLSWGSGKGAFSWYVPLAVLKGHTYHIEFYWNGNLLASVPVRF
jgi:hypothetical protein